MRAGLSRSRGNESSSTNSSNNCWREFFFFRVVKNLFFTFVVVVEKHYCFNVGSIGKLQFRIKSVTDKYKACVSTFVNI